MPILLSRRARPAGTLLVVMASLTLVTDATLARDPWEPRGRDAPDRERYGEELGQDERGVARGEYGPPIAWFKDPAGNILAVIEVGPDAS